MAIQTVSTDNSYHVINNTTALVAGTTLDGVVIRDGRADGTETASFGGGLVNVAPVNLITSIIVRNCLFADNYAAGVGGALVNYANTSGFASVEATNCLFTGNIAIYRGGAIFNGKTNANPANAINTGGNQLTMTDCRFSGNSTTNSVGQGGALHLKQRW